MRRIFTKFPKSRFSWFPTNELVFLVLLLFLANNFIVRDGQVIRSDGKGYYDYLPAAFIYSDLNFNFTDTLVTKYYNHKEQGLAYFNEVNGNRINKYFAGTAIMQLPFFLAAHALAGQSDAKQADGYSDYYQKAIYFAAIFYALLGLFFVRLSLTRLGVKSWWIFWIQAAVFFASSLLHYVISDPAFSHVYSFALISIFTYLVLSVDFDAFSTKHVKPQRLIGMALVLGLITLVRPVNIIVVIFIPFLMLISKQNPKHLLHLFKRKKVLLAGVFAFVIPMAIQPVIWFVQTGDFWVTSYGEESFDLLNPHFSDFLFSYRKGFFVYAPVFFILLSAGLMASFNQKSHPLTLSFFAPFLILVYVLSSWWYWSYGASFGSRVMVDFYPILVLVIVPFFNLSKSWTKWLSIPMVVLFGAISLIQTYQYKNYILSWDDMTAKGYWQVFLKMDKKYEGLLWQIPWREDWSDEEILSTPVLSIEHLQNNIQVFDLEVERDFPKLAVLVEGDCSYDFGSSEFVLEIRNNEDEIVYYHQQAVFKASGLENFQGSFRLVYYVNPLEIGNYQLKVRLQKTDQIDCENGLIVSVHGMK